MLLLERNLGTAPNPLTWKASESLLILIPQNLGFFWCVKESCIPSSVAKKYKYLLCSTKSLSRGVTLIYLRHSSIEVCHHSTLLTHLITFLGSYCSVNFHTEPPFRPGIISKILYYNIRKKCHISQAFFSFILKNFRQERLRLELNK